MHMSWSEEASSIDISGLCQPEWQWTQTNPIAMRACNEKSEASKHNQVHSAGWDSKYQRCCGDHDDGGCYHGDEQEHYTLVSIIQAESRGGKPQPDRPKR